MAITRVQQRSVQGNGTSISLAFSSNITGGNYAIACTSAWDNHAWASGDIHDQNSNNYVIDVSDNTGRGQAITHFYYSSGGAVTVTSTIGASSGYSLCIAEYSGLATSSVVGGSNIGTSSSGSSLDSGAFTTTAGSLIIGYGSDAAAGTWSAGTNYTMVTSVNAGTSCDGAMEEWIGTSGGSIHATMSMTNSSTWTCGGVEYKAAGGGLIWQQLVNDVIMIIPNEIIGY